MIELQTGTLRSAPFVSLCSLCCRHPCCCVSLRLAVRPAEPERNRTSLSNQRGNLCWVLMDHQVEKPRWKAASSAGPFFRTAFWSSAVIFATLFPSQRFLLLCSSIIALCHFVSLVILYATLFPYLSSLLLHFLGSTSCYIVSLSAPFANLHSLIP